MVWLLLEMTNATGIVLNQIAATAEKRFGRIVRTVRNVTRSTFGAVVAQRVSDDGVRVAVAIAVGVVLHRVVRVAAGTA